MAMTSNAAILPSEIWQKVTELACVDGGRTGVSLALSCKYLHAQTFAGRFYSLALRSLAQLESFVSFVTSLKCPQENVPSTTSQGGHFQILRVRHLWLSFRNEMPPPGPPTPGTSAKGPSMISKAEWDARILTGLHALLPLIAPTLLTLVLAQQETWPLPPDALAPPFPQLTELTFLGGPTDGRGAAISSTAHWPFDLARRPFPALRRLHVIADFYSQAYARRALLTAPAHAPTLRQLTHLRLSGLSEGDCADLAGGGEEPLAAALALALGVSPTTPSTLDSTLPGLPRPPLERLRHLVLHGVGTPGAPCAFSATLWDNVVCALAAVVLQWGPHARVPGHIGSIAGAEHSAVLMDRPWRRDFKWEARVWGDWVARMEGGRGCWVEDEEEEEAREGPRDPEDNVEWTLYD